MGSDVLIKNNFGYCCYEFKKDPIGNYVHIYNLFVSQKFRRQGHARKLLQSAINAIRGTGYKDKIQIVANTKDSHIDLKILIDFYKSFGLDVFTYYG